MSSGEIQFDPRNTRFEERRRLLREARDQKGL
jgi:hypothetical protein